MRRTKKTKKTRMQGHMAVAISMAMAAGLALTGCGSTGTTGVSAERSAGGKNEAGRNTAGNTAGGQEESQSGKQRNINHLIICLQSFCSC